MKSNAYYFAVASFVIESDLSMLQKAGITAAAVNKSAEMAIKALQF